VQNKQLIESGILESHLLGIASDTEKIEVQRHLKESQEILEYVYELDKDLQSFFNVQSVPPPPNLRVELEARIGRSELQKNHVSGESDRTQGGASKENSKENYLEVEVSDTYIRVHKLWRPAFLLVFILSKVFLILALYYFFKTNSLKDEVDRLTQQNTETLTR
jgi:hypothetical protein